MAATQFPSIITKTTTMSYLLRSRVASTRLVTPIVKRACFSTTARRFQQQQKIDQDSKVTHFGFRNVPEEEKESLGIIIIIVVVDMEVIMIGKKENVKRLSHFILKPILIHYSTTSVRQCCR